MKNSKIEISEKWTVHRDEFYDVNPWSDSFSNDEKFDNVYAQEDMLLIRLNNFKLDLSWYGGEKEGFFGLHLFHGKDWHNCHLLEKRKISKYDLLIQTIDTIVKNVEIGNYNSIDFKNESIDDHIGQETIITIE